MVYRESLTLRQTARVCSVCRSTVLNWINAGALKAFTTRNGHYRIIPANLRRFLDESGMDIPFVMPTVRNTHVLIIDSNRHYSAVLGREIEEEFPSMEACIAENVHEGIVLIRAVHPQMLILELELPEMSGFDFLSLIRRWEGPHDMNVLAMTAGLDDQTREHALTLGADCAMDKLSDIDLILQTVASLTGSGERVPLGKD